MSLYRIGVDVGGTNTDAALLDITAADTPGRGVLASHKASTTPDITSGIEAAIRTVLEKSAVDQKRVLSVTIGTTHFINALVEADTRRLSRVAVIRLCGPFTRQIPPFSDFPSGLHRILDGGVYYLDGGLEIDGREIAPLDREQIRRATREIVAAGVKSVALVGIFAPLDHAGIHEETCKKIILEEAPDLDVVCSHDIGPPGLLERENATILNAAILGTARKVTRGFKTAVARLKLACPLYLSQNDGTLIDADTAARYPIKTFASGPTNSMTGAAFLAGLDRVKTMTTDPTVSPGERGLEPQILVVDIGGTTTDVCALLPSGFPRQAPGFVEVGGVRTAFSMPEVVSIGLGGGSKVVETESGLGDVMVGPASVGHFLTAQARVFGGPTLTATDIVVALGKARLGDASLIKDLPSSTIDSARKRIKKMLEGVIEQMKVSAAPVHVLLVGGGALLVTEGLDGVEKCIQPIHQGAANAVGAAIGKVSGEVDVIEILEGRDEKAVVAATCQKAIDIAVQKGAAAQDVRVVEVNKMPLQYVDNGAMRIQVRAVGKLRVPENPDLAQEAGFVVENEQEEDEAPKESVPDALQPVTKPSLHVDLENYRPNVESGACEPGKMRIISPKALSDTDMVCFGSWYGTPSVINERIAGGSEISNGIDAVRKILGDVPLDGVFIDEIGGGNGLSVFPTGVHYDIPVVDGDAMGRAYPTMYQDTPVRLERFLRTAAIELGLGCAVCARPLPGSAIKSHGVPNTLSQAWYLGRAVHMARRKKSNHVDAIFNVCAGKLLFTGKIVDVRRYVGGGYTMGSVLIAPLADEDVDLDAPRSASGNRHMLIPFQNEYLYAALTDSEGSESNQEVICTVPDLISILGQDGEAVGSQDLRYGLRVSVIALPAHPLWKTEKGLPVGGPKAFGLDMPFVGVGEYTEPRSVIEEFGH
ncbi:Hydantoin utilization protein A [Colletotrichum higginsianum]|uniref:Hydantoin utilization protein A n=1 Tax=Colletotrichum higginsianum TaxID=80884 RepID=A0A4T0VES7_9PEZI|nr:Hydantoin utilization protein A [Colletotrichum higginsianum]